MYKKINICILLSGLMILGICTAKVYSEEVSQQESVEKGKRAFLGIGLIPLEEKGKKEAIVTSVSPNSPAEAAGININDIFVKIDAKAVSSAEDLSEFMRGKRAGDKVTVTISRKSKEQKIPIVLSELPDYLLQPRLFYEAKRAYNDKNYKESAQMYEEGIKMGTIDGGTFYDAACSFALIGYKEKALTYLEKAIDNGYHNFEWMKGDSDLVSLHEEARFAKVLQKCGNIQEDVKKFLEEATIYKAGREWVYRGKFLNSNGEVTSSQSITLNIPGGDFLGQQIMIKWSYEKGGAEVTGIIDNPKRVWSHPPRGGDFRFTELTSFPEIIKPFKKGDKWGGVLHIGQGWGELEGLDINNYYEVIGQKDVSTAFKNFKDCWQVDTRTESKKGNYKVTYYFHPEYGFVRWEYTNPDSTKVILDLEKVSGF